MSLARRLNPRIEEWMIILDNPPHHVMHAPQANLHQKTQKNNLHDQNNYRYLLNIDVWLSKVKYFH